MKQFDPSQDAIEPVGVLEALIAPLKGAGIAREVLANRVKNVVVPVTPGKSTVLSGRLPASPADITHAYRNTSTNELKNLVATDRLRKNPNPGNTTWDAGSKYFSPGDAQGAFGRSWKGAQPETLRVPVDKVPKNWAVKSKDVERLNRATGQYEPVKKMASGGTVRGAGCAKRGVKKCKTY